MENVVVSNGLECKICLTTYRLFYVQDTHDFFYRRYESTLYTSIRALLLLLQITGHNSHDFLALCHRGSLEKAKSAKKRVFGGAMAAGARPEIKSLDDIAPTYTPPAAAPPQPEAQQQQPPAPQALPPPQQQPESEQPEPQQPEPEQLEQPQPQAPPQ
jgi:hypothetical protein